MRVAEGIHLLKPGVILSVLGRIFVQHIVITTSVIQRSLLSMRKHTQLVAALLSLVFSSCGSGESEVLPEEGETTEFGASTSVFTKTFGCHPMGCVL